MAIDLDDVYPDGRLAGTARIGVSEQADGATNGSYRVEGGIDWKTGRIQLEGTSWVDQGGLIGWGGFTGYVDLSTGTIEGQWYDPEGEAEPGNWYMQAT